MQVSPFPTEAERALAALFDARSSTFSDAPLDAARAEAFRRFAAAGLPHRRVEAYRYTDLKARLRTLPPQAREADGERVDELLAAHPPLPGVTNRVVIANGRLVIGEAPEGMTVNSILDPSADTAFVGSLVTDSDDPLTLANVGLFDGGAVLHASTETPLIEVVHLATDDTLVMGRVAIRVASGARVQVIERAVAAHGAVMNNLTELVVEDGARADLIRFAEGSDDASTQLSTLHARIGERSVLEHLTLNIGEGLSRAQVFCHVAGGEAAANFRTATVALGKRHADTTLVVRHDALNSSSTEEFRSAVGRRGTAIVQGRIIVDPGAQKTDAKMMSRALFLDETGEVVNKPELEIFADDVQCGHGATSGDLDEEMIFYLRSRGIPEVEARRLLIDAFLLDALDRIEDEALADALAQHLRDALSDADEHEGA